MGVRGCRNIYEMPQGPNLINAANKNCADRRDAIQTPAQWRWNGNYAA
jgi:hypothetical protein